MPRGLNCATGWWEQRYNADAQQPAPLASVLQHLAGSSRYASLANFRALSQHVFAALAAHVHPEQHRQGCNQFAAFSPASAWTQRHSRSGAHHWRLAQLQAMRELLLLVLLAALPEAATLDLAIAGAGPVGTSAALRAAELGKSVAID